MTTVAMSRPVQPWARHAARALPLLALPLCLWRLPIGFGFRMGMDVPREDLPLWMTVPYVLALSLLSEAFALLCGGLVRPWGERLPARVVVAVGAVSGAGFTLLAGQWVLTTFHVGGFRDVGYVSGWWRTLAAVTSGLFVLWGPVILALTYGYHRRRSGRAGLLVAEDDQPGERVVGAEWGARPVGGGGGGAGGEEAGGEQMGGDGDPVVAGGVQGGDRLRRGGAGGGEVGGDDGPSVAEAGGEQGGQPCGAGVGGGVGGARGGEDDRPGARRPPGGGQAVGERGGEQRVRAERAGQREVGEAGGGERLRQVDAQVVAAAEQQRDQYGRPPVQGGERLGEGGPGEVQEAAAHVERGAQRPHPLQQREVRGDPGGGAAAMGDGQQDGTAHQAVARR